MNRDSEKGVWDLETFLEIFSYKVPSLKDVLSVSFISCFSIVFFPISDQMNYLQLRTNVTSPKENSHFTHLLVGYLL